VLGMLNVDFYVVLNWVVPQSQNFLSWEYSYAMEEAPHGKNSYMQQDLLCCFNNFDRKFGCQNKFWG